jgi:hypothetical protein
VGTAASDKPVPQEDETVRSRVWQRTSRILLFWRRLPTPLLITLIGLALSAWLLPAFTRQWDDRQKARELQASLITQISTATANALIAGRNLVLRPLTGPRSRAHLISHSAVAAWSSATIRTDARLRAYFPTSVVNSWATYSFDLGVLLENLSNPVNEGFSDSPIYFPPTIPWPRMSEVEARPEFQSAFRAQRKIFQAEELYLRHLRLPRSDVDARERRSDLLGKDALDRVNAYIGAETQWLKVEEGINSEILAAHPRGYSTTWSDLVHDLIP